MSETDDLADYHSEEWHRILTGTERYVKTLRRFWSLIPAPPRCKVCAAPFRGIGKYATLLAMHGRSTHNPMICNFCIGSLATRPGGAEIDVSVLFADLRGSTGLAEKTDPTRFGDLLERFYELAVDVVECEKGIIDKFLGDGVMALFIPGFAGPDHPARAVAAGRRLLARSEAGGGSRPGLPMGIGVHSGPAFVGVLGSGDRLDFTALGDTVNVAARLASAAGPGELLVTTPAWQAAGLAPRPTDCQFLTLEGRDRPVEVVRLDSRN